MSDFSHNRDDASEYYQEQIRMQFSALKSLTRYDELIAQSLRLPNGRGYLATVSQLHADDRSTIELLTAIRSRVTTFPSQFVVTSARTRKWLRTLLLDVPDRILFFVLSRSGAIVGHMGFAHCDNDERRMEVDNVVRANGTEAPGLMSVALDRLCMWAEECFTPREIYLRVLEDNQHAVRFYERRGVRAFQRQPLRRVESIDEVNFVPRAPDDTDPPDRIYLFMRRK